MKSNLIWVMLLAFFFSMAGVHDVHGKSPRPKAKNAKKTVRKKPPPNLFPWDVKGRPPQFLELDGGDGGRLLSIPAGREGGPGVTPPIELFHAMERVDPSGRPLPPWDSDRTAGYEGLFEKKTPLIKFDNLGKIHIDFLR